MLNGGIPARRHIAVSGGPGSGKTSFSFQFLYYGAKNGEPGVFITLQERVDDIIENMQHTFTAFTDIPQLVEEKKLIIARPDRFDFDGIAEILENAMAEQEVKRFVLDSTTIIKMAFSSLHEYRQTLYEFFCFLRNVDCTGMITVEVEHSSRTGMKYDIEHYVADGVINLYQVDQGEKRIRALEIMKMRATDHHRGLVPFKVMPDGIVVYPSERVYASW